MCKHFDAGSLKIIAITFVLFSLALFTQGLTHIFFRNRCFPCVGKTDFNGI